MNIDAELKIGLNVTFVWKAETVCSGVKNRHSIFTIAYNRHRHH